MSGGSYDYVSFKIEAAAATLRERHPHAPHVLALAAHLDEIADAGSRREDTRAHPAGVRARHRRTARARGARHANRNAREADQCLTSA